MLRTGCTRKRARLVSLLAFTGILLGPYSVLNAQDSFGADVRSAGLQAFIDAHPHDSVVNSPTLTSRVLGGGNAPPGEYPSMAGIVLAGSFALEDRFFCGASVIDSRWVLTAAHCMFGPFGSPTRADEIRVIVGSNDISDSTVVETVVTNIFVHPQYDNSSQTLINDIALLELATAVDAPVATLFSGNAESLYDSMASVVGWGATGVDSSGNEVYPALLQDASVPVVSLEQCNLPESYQGTIVNTQICAGFREGGVDSCVGDSGGPMFSRIDGQQVQIGITSFGNGCGLPNFYGVYTNISEFQGWVNSYIDSVQTSNAGAPNGESTETSASLDVENVETNNAAERLVNESGAVSVGGVRRGGALHPICLALMGVVFMLRRKRNLNRRSRLPMLACIFAPALLLNACSSLPSGDERDANELQLSSQDTGVDVENQIKKPNKRLRIMASSNRVGIDLLLLGMARSDLDSSLASMGFSAPVCSAEKTALKGTGRLFLRESCKSLVQQTIVLEEMSVESLDAQFLDEQLVRLDIAMQSGVIRPLVKELDDLFSHQPVQDHQFEWRYAQDHIRLAPMVAEDKYDMSRVMLEMIDGRLKSKLPSLFEYRS